jgi:hypothetical protein
MGLTKIFDNLMSGIAHTRTNPKSGEHGFGRYEDISPNPPRSKAKLGIYGNPTASRRNLTHDYSIIPPDIQYLGISPLSSCPFDPDVIVIIGNPRQLTMASRALQYFSGITPKSETGPGTCSSSWVAAFLKGEARYTLGCHGVFGTMGIDPNEICLSIPSELVPTLCQNLELWRKREKYMFQEAPPNEEREYIQAPYDAEYVKDDYKKQDYIPWEQRLTEQYKGWKTKREKDQKR